MIIKLNVGTNWLQLLQNNYDGQTNEQSGRWKCVQNISYPKQNYHNHFGRRPPTQNQTIHSYVRYM